MTSAISLLDEVREALENALQQEQWESIGQLDQQCRLCVDLALAESTMDEVELKHSLHKLLSVYRLLIAATTVQRNQIANEITQLRRSNQVAKVYQLFG
jgi:hypothetical protein